MSKLLPPDFDDLLFEAVKLFWSTKAKTSTSSQGGTRSSVLSGKHMDGFMEIALQVAQHVGLPDSGAHVKGAKLNLPGYFRASKNWDAVFIYQGRLLAALEFKSQVGSFGNNQNNRIEEVIGLGQDFWTAREAGLMTSDIAPKVQLPAGQHVTLAQDARPPFLGYLLMLERTYRSAEHRPKLRTGQFQLDTAFSDTSYADRYRIMADRLMAQRLYSGVGVMLSEQELGLVDGAHSRLSKSTSVRALFSSFAAHLLAALEV